MENIVHEIKINQQTIENKLIKTYLRHLKTVERSGKVPSSLNFYFFILNRIQVRKCFKV